MFASVTVCNIVILALASASCAAMKKREVDALYRAFGTLMRLRREQRPNPLSQEKLGHLVGLSRTSITNIEKGRHHIMLHQLLAFARALKVRPEALSPKDRRRGAGKVPRAGKGLPEP
jgi:DNA-binding XRE family transcriptional regulator